jgi:hypothetical protein
MKLFKKVITILLIVVFFVVLGFWSPWNKMNLSFLNIFGIETANKYATLKVKSLHGEVSIYIDDEFKGVATDNSDFAEINPIEPGEHTITLKKETNGNYYQFERKVNFEPSLDVVVAYDLGPLQIFSEGHLLYTRKNYLNSVNPRVTIYSSVESVTVYLDEKEIGNTVLKDVELDNSKQHKLKFTKEGYDSMEITLLPESQSDRDKLKNYDLILEVTLFTQPIKVNKQNN